MSTATRAHTVRRNAIVGVASRSATIVATLVAFPLLLHHLGPARFGIWATVTSVQGFLSFADLGLGTAAANLVADAEARGDRAAARATIANTYLFLTAVAAVIIAGTLGASAATDLSGLVGGTGEQTELALVICISGIAAAIPLSVVTRVQTALRRSGVAYVWVGAGALLGLLANAACVLFGGGVAAAVAGTVAGPILALAVNTVVFFRQEPTLRPRFADPSRLGIRVLLPAGAAFFIQQSSVAVGHQSDALIVAQVLGPTAATQYVLPAKLFYLGPVLLTFALLPMWPEIRQSIARDDLASARAAVRRMAKSTVAAGAAAAVALLALGAPVVSAWSSGEVAMDQGLTIAFAAWMLASCVTIACGFTLAGLGGNRTIAGLYLAMAVVNLPLSIALTHSVGLAGVVIGTTVANTVCVVLPSLVLVPRRFRQLRETSDVAAANREK